MHVTNQIKYIKIQQTAKRSLCSEHRVREWNIAFERQRRGVQQTAKISLCNENRIHREPALKYEEGEILRVCSKKNFWGLGDTFLQKPGTYRQLGNSLAICLAS